VTAIKGALAKSSAQRANSPQPAARPALGASAPTAGPRSNNLRVAKRFTEQDKDTFLHKAFDYFARYFEGSLAEPHARNPEIKGRFRRIDGTALLPWPTATERPWALCDPAWRGHGVPRHHVLP
jgi:hypothetical protein